MATGRIVTVYTEAFGRCSFILQGIHSKNHQTKPTFTATFPAGHGDRSQAGLELQRAREIRTNHPYQTVPYDIVKASQALLAELLFKVLKEEEARPKLFQFLSHSFQIFDLLQHGEPISILPLIQLTRYMGFAPTDNFS